MNVTLRDEQLRQLRESGIITDNEIVVKVGDLYVAEHIITKDRRQVDIDKVLSESKRRVLKG